MEDIELTELWKAYDKKLEENLAFNRDNAAELTRLKIGSLLSSMKPLKLFTIIAGMLWVGFGSTILINLCIHALSAVSPFFLTSAALQLLITLIALAVYIYQLVLIEQIDLDRPILETQEHLARLRSSTLWVTRILLLQLPLWTTFYLSIGMFIQANMGLLIIQGIVTVIFTYFAVWLFVNIKLENHGQKWFKLIFEGKEWTPLMRSLALLEQIKEYKTVQ